MDTLTHIALGACIGELILGNKLGKKAMLWGAIANSIPDIDFIASAWMNPANYLLAHRGFTHSILFLLIVTPVLSIFAERIHRPHNIYMRRWIWFFGIEIGTHLFIDAFNAYGIGWFEPFNHYRVSFNVIFVADPFFSIWIGTAFIILFFLRRKSAGRRLWATFGITMSSVYLMYCLINKYEINQSIRRDFTQEQITTDRYFATPTPFNNWLWYIVVEKDNGFYIGYRSVFDVNTLTSYRYFPRNDSLLRGITNHEDLQHLIRFSKGFYTVERWNDTLVFNDLRFEQVTGWENPDAHFVFHYFLKHPEDNKLVVQRGRFENWNWKTFNSMVQRIKGM